MALMLAITGGTGFVGGHTIHAALARGHKVLALARKPQPPREGVGWVPGHLADEAALDLLTARADAVIHIAGVTNAPDRAGFEQGNILGTAYVRRAAQGRPLVHVSSLSAREPQLSTYGWSKLMGEQIARGAAGPVATLRPPAVYGPGDREFLELMRTARSGFIPMPRGSLTSMVYGADLGEALVALAEELSGPARSEGQIYEINDGNHGYTPAQVADAIGAAIGRRVRAVPVSAATLRLAAMGDTAWAKLKGTQPRLTRDRAGYMAHPDWSSNSAALLALNIWQPRTGLMAGMAETARSYRAQGLLP
ncbi:NAD(P)-dependent oxidoreductase [Sandaracinobacter neustonicus]|uniref:NAD(P)-dependent oxidoreductase n=1 Tax=Sandaracinobacter neustonicus TaxID=1715348 RepID=A0A501XPX0_9SPHN|nr:NAD(P)-dependent oxidoreductase [Sandaracinobacter neustonicus]TPE62157.1 NAD(P)-dependent oxidoreductase [Sandaracinobacter neustonicus]